ncbi:MAG: orotidine 5'-phosphate decarboxylase [Thermoproteota archaeon]|nr:orotidine 5'-phosphate decarboxylase [Thermoproteota archaeon]
MTRVHYLASFRNRIEQSSKLKNSRIVLSIDPIQTSQPKRFALKSIKHLQHTICAVKLNFHLILPLSKSDLSEVNKLAHFYGLQSIADVKLNDISNTNQIAIQYLIEMGFDSVIVNPFMGRDVLRSAVHQTHESNCGVIALVYMSHHGAKDCYGANVVSPKTKRITKMYEYFHNMTIDEGVDGIVVGATNISILKEISKRKTAPIYSPGLGAQGGRINSVTKNGADYLIIGRSILSSIDPVREAKKFQLLMSNR